MRKTWTVALVLGVMGAAGLVQAADPGVGALAATVTAAAKVTTTLDNLRSAAVEGTNAMLRYGSFAARADAEGYKGVAVLFRACAVSESIHLKKALQAIEKAGGNAADVKPAAVTVGTTLENLQSVRKTEIASRAASYAGFATQAAKDKNPAAVYVFKGAAAAAQEQGKFASEALKNLAAWKADGRVFAVCGVCGYTVMGQPPASCPICQAPADKFTVIK